MKPDSVCRAAVIYGLEDVPSGVRAIVQDGIPPHTGVSPLCVFPSFTASFVWTVRLPKRKIRDSFRICFPKWQLL